MWSWLCSIKNGISVLCCSTKTDSISNNNSGSSVSSLINSSPLKLYFLTTFPTKKQSSFCIAKESYSSFLVASASGASASAAASSAGASSTVASALGAASSAGASTSVVASATGASASGVAFTDGTQTKAGVPSITNIPTALAAGAQTIASGRADQFIPLTGAVVITLPATGYSTGQSIDFYQASGTGASFASTNSVVGTPGLKFRTTNSVVTAMKTSSGWLVFGDLSA